MAQDYLHDYIWVGVGIVGGAVDTVEQKIVKVTPKTATRRKMLRLDIPHRSNKR